MRTLARKLAPVLARTPLSPMFDLLRQARLLLELEVAAVGPFLPGEGNGVLRAPERGNESSDAGEQPNRRMPVTSGAMLFAAETAESDRLLALIPPDSPIRSIETLDELAEYVASNRLIPIDETRTKPVFGVGNPDAELMVIGEAPGADEDAQGEPFVGRAGQLLNKILEATGFSRDEVYIANILKSRPPNNRDPQSDEIAAHAPILYRQISLIRPRMLLSVGRISATVLVGRQGSLSSLRGKLHDFHGIPLVVTYHPAALLRNPEWKRPTWEDMKFLRGHFDRLVARG